MTNETWLGKTIDHYEVTKFIGEGGMAEVYLAEDTKLDRQVCLKVLLLEKLQRDDIIARFKQEAQVIAKLNHPNILRIYSIGKTETNQPYLALEYIDGGSVYDYLYPDPPQPKPVVSPAQALKWVKQIAEALDHAHRMGIVHRDLKPANILLRGGDSPVLADFGIAVITEVSQRITLTGQRMPGTPDYMSPEQADSQDDLDGRSDIYSLGLILYELLADERPKKQANLRKTRPGLTEATYQVVDTCRQPKPAQRYQTTQSLIQALDKAITAEMMSPTWPAPPSEHRPWWRAGWVYGAGAGLLLILIIAALIFWRRDAHGGITAVSRNPSLNLNPAATLPLTVIATDTQFDIVTVVASSTATEP
ncbi:MAG: serine/threonine-protein kinase, partial [Anaerolineae bacterium]